MKKNELENRIHDLLDDVINILVAEINNEQFNDSIDNLTMAGVSFACLEKAVIEHESKNKDSQIELF